MHMLNINDFVWKPIDNVYEEYIEDNVRFIRKIGDKSLNIECELCKSLITTLEDVESVKEKNICAECYLVYYYPNKENWHKGWRPK